MKNINFVRVAAIFSSLLVMATISCSKVELEDGAVLNNVQTIKVTGEDVNASTNKTTLDGFNTLWIASTDKVGVYSPEASLTSGGAAGVTNTPYTASSSAITSLFTGGMYWKTGLHHFYAYYPYNSGYSGLSSAVPFVLPSAQTQNGSSSADVGTYDFMVATPVSVEAGTENAATTVDFKYNHVFTLMEFKLKHSTPGMEIISINLEATGGQFICNEAGVIDITQSTPATGAPYTYAGGDKSNITVTIPCRVTMTDDYITTPSIYMMMLPYNLTGVTMHVVVVYINAAGTEKYTTADIVKTGTNFLRGNKYLVQMDLSGVSATTSNIVKDVDCNVYNIVTIGTQTWMAENLKTTKYNDGTAIPNVTDGTAWAARTAGAYCWYNNDAANKATYGALYNWFAVDNNAGSNVASNGGKDIAPAGWHVATLDDWTTLGTYLGGQSVAGGKLKETGYTHWNSPNTGADNTLGFTALGGGYRYPSNGAFYSIGSQTIWWNSTDYNTINARTSLVSNSDSWLMYNIWVKQYGGYVRCIKN